MFIIKKDYCAENKENTMKKCLSAAFVLLFATQAQASVLELIESIKQNNVPEVLALLDKGENVNAANEQGNTPLHYAVATDNADITEILLAKGADLNAANAKGWTPLKIAEQKQVPNVLPILQNALQQKSEAVAAKVAQPAEQVVAKAQKVAANSAEKAADVADKAKEVVTAADNTATATAETLTEAEKEQYRALIERAKEGVLAAQHEKDAMQARNKELENELAKLKAENASLEKRLTTDNTAKPATQAAAKSAPATQKTTEKPKVATKTASVAPKPAVKKVTTPAKPSILNPQIFAGHEEIVYCLNYLGQGDDKNMLKAAGYYASAVGIGEARYNQIANISNSFFTSSGPEMLKKRSDDCGKIITPPDANKQNMIIRSLNYAIGH